MAILILIQQRDQMHNILTLKDEITRILHFRVPKSANSCFTQLSRHIANQYITKLGFTHPKKIKMYNHTYITNHGDMTKLALKISCKYTTHRSCTSPKVYKKYRCLYAIVIFLKALKISISNGQLHASSRSFPTIETTIAKHIDQWCKNYRF